MRLQHETDLDDPKQRFGWAFREITVNGNPTAIPEPVLEEWSQRLAQAGFLHIDQVRRTLGDEAAAQLPQQEIHYQPPIRGQDHAMNTSGGWVPVSEPLKQPMVPTSALMTKEEKAKMIQEFREEGIID